LIISGKEVKKDLYKGSDVEITLEMTESRDLTISVHLPTIGQDFSQVFRSQNREVNFQKLNEEVEDISEAIEKEMRAAEEEQNFEKAAKLKELRQKSKQIQRELSQVTEGNVTDKRYQLEDEKRALAQSFDQATKGKKADLARQAYEEEKQRAWELVDNHGTQAERQTFEHIISLESGFINSENPATINRKTEELHQLSIQILWRVPEFLMGLFRHLAKDSMAQYEDQMQAMSLIQMGAKAIQAEDWPRLRDVNMQLLQMLPRSARQGFNFRGTGI
jgi:molecular chaperone DnaK